MSAEREVVAVDDSGIYEGMRELVDWDRRDAIGNVVTHRNVPVMYLRQVSREDYHVANPGAPRHHVPNDGYFFWEVSID